ncbi:BLUF domain-containing protein [Hymenobacter antarcticus]|uniref:BLUF domain-containing protein n=1 Tax=Hymenobacter antarcticus TaxID=486270 RepID=A0ABP7R1M3_9BACT
MGIYQLIYQSQSLVPFEKEEIVAMLAVCRAYNTAHHITGLLLYTPDGRFLQVLEGEESAVRGLYLNRVITDPRHFNSRVYSEGPALKRSFPNWPLGFREASASVLRTLLSNVPPDRPGLLVPRPHTRPELMKLLKEFLAHTEVDATLPDPWPADARPVGVY